MILSYIIVFFSLASLISEAFTPRWCFFRGIRSGSIQVPLIISKSRCNSNSYHSLAVTNENEDDEYREYIDSRSSSFDSDFADAMSKPIPQWYKDAEKQRKEQLKEILANRERILSEFKAKYEVTEDQKTEERRLKWEKIKERMKQSKSKKESRTWLNKFIKDINKKVDVYSSNIDDIKLDDIAIDDIDGDSDDVTTKEKWEKFWEEEEKQTGFSLPGFFEVFPELQLRWPKWGKRKDGSAIDCETDNDCPFPYACCNHPIIPGQKFCCTGWGQRIMVPAYARQEIQSSWDVEKSEKEKANRGGYE